MEKLYGGLLALAIAVTPAAAVEGDEFLGPLAGWANLSADYGAAGDGRSDDTPALQRALDQLGTPGKPVILYIPAGTYRITRTLAMRQRIGISILGEDPARTTILWDGSPGKTMLDLDGVSYSRFGRLTWDGSGKAETACDHGWNGKHPHAVSHCERADEVFRGVAFGLRGGSRGFQDAEFAVLRCRFLGCSKAGVSIENFNALNWFLWDCFFDRCRLGVTNVYGAGNFFVYRSLFRGSTEADVAIGNLACFALRRNWSQSSKAFFTARAYTSGAMLTFQGNTIVDPADSLCIRVDNVGPVVLLDNVIRGRAAAAAPAVTAGRGDIRGELVSVGNTYTTAFPLAAQGRVFSLDDRTVQPGRLRLTAPEPVPPLARARRRVIEVPAGADAAVIQDALRRAGRFAGQRPVVHLPAGKYTIRQTLVLPPASDVQLVGDGLVEATRLVWAGPPQTPLLRLHGPSRATLRDLQIDGGGEGDGLVVESADQRGGRVYGEQLMLEPKNRFGLVVAGLDSTQVTLPILYHAGNDVSVRVLGGPLAERGQAVAARVALLGGASADNRLSYDVTRGGRLVVEDLYYESVRLPRLARLADTGMLALQGISAAVKSTAEEPAAIEADDFQGRVALLSNVLHSVSQTPAEIAFRGRGQRMHALVLGCQSNDPPRASPADFPRNASSSGTIVAMANRAATAEGSRPLPDSGKPSAEWLRRMLAPIREESFEPLTPCPPGATDVRLYRVSITNTRAGLHLLKGRLGP